MPAKRQAAARAARNITHQYSTPFVPLRHHPCDERNTAGRYEQDGDFKVGSHLHRSYASLFPGAFKDTRTSGSSPASAIARNQRAESERRRLERKRTASYPYDQYLVDPVCEASAVREVTPLGTNNTMCDAEQLGESFESHNSQASESDTSPPVPQLSAQTVAPLHGFAAAAASISAVHRSSAVSFSPIKAPHTLAIQSRNMWTPPSPFLPASPLRWWCTPSPPSAPSSSLSGPPEVEAEGTQVPNTNETSSHAIEQRTQILPASPDPSRQVPAKPLLDGPSNIRISEGQLPRAGTPGDRRISKPGLKAKRVSFWRPTPPADIEPSEQDRRRKNLAAIDSDWAAFRVSLDMRLAALDNIGEA